MDMSAIVGRAIDTVHVEGSSFVEFVMLDGDRWRLHNMRLDSWDGELADLLDGVIVRTDVTDDGYFSKRVCITMRNSLGRQVSFNFSGGMFDSLVLSEVY